MGVTEDLADKLADDVLDLIDDGADDFVITEIARALGASSSTAEEAFLTSVRVRRADRRARQLLEQKIAAHNAAKVAQPNDETLE